MLPRLQYITQGETIQQHLDNLLQALDAGIELAQLRLKSIDQDIYTETAIKAKKLCVGYNAKLIINDNVHFAIASEAYGIHVGLEDMPVSKVRILAPDLIVGGTANTIEHIRQRAEEKVDYIGLGPFRFTSTKEKLSPILGVEGFEDILKQMHEEHIHIPVYAIGGIELNDVKNLIRTGVYGIALSGVITHSNEKEKLVNELNKLIYHAENC